MQKTKIKNITEGIVWLSSIKLDDSKQYSIEVKEYKEPRSLNANNLCWVMCEQIAQKMRITKEEVYREQIKDVGVFIDDIITPDKVHWRMEAWNRLGIGWFCERVDFDKDYEVIRFYYGSSCYNTKQMSRLIDNLTNECKMLGIPTKDELELERIVSQWQ